MNNREIANILSETSRLMELHGVNEFKIKSVQNAAFNIGRMETDITQLNSTEIESLKGIGKSISQKIVEIISTGTLNELEQMINATPAGVIEMMNLKGIGPKKVAVLWKQLAVESPGELLYACNENRLTELKGFGLKTQDQIKKAIEFSNSNRGMFHYASAEESGFRLMEIIKILPSINRIVLTGELRRKCEVIRQIDFLAEAIDFTKAISDLKSLHCFTNSTSEIFNDRIHFLSENEPLYLIHFTSQENFAVRLIQTTGNQDHLDKIDFDRKFSFDNQPPFSDEISAYRSIGLQFIEPELREGNDEVSLASGNAIPELINFNDLKGCLHNHSTYSDGSNPLREMALECKKLGYEYFGICDHSKSAFYANGLSEERVLQQHAEIDLLNAELNPFVIFKGIESDILPDGSLDYSTEVLSRFDFVVASVHSVLKMNIQRATERLITAISNPFTTMLGHPTGRLLLAREGYPIDHKSVIDACANFNVVIELNAHPYRLDLDWRWIRYAIDKGVMISINPDAHHISGLSDMYYGVCAARKGMLTGGHTFNALSIDSVRKWFEGKKAANSVRC